MRSIFVIFLFLLLSSSLGYADQVFDDAKEKAKHGDADAQYKVGLAYENGHGVKRDYAEAVKWWRKAAELNLDEAQRALGYSYKDGRGVKRNYEEAYFWALLGRQEFPEDEDWYLPGRINEHLTHAQRRAVDNRVRKWLRNAIERGDRIAPSKLGFDYLESKQIKGVEPDYAEAYFWLSVGNYPDPNAPKPADAAKHLTAAQKAAVDLRIRGWQPRPTKTP